MMACKSLFGESLASRSVKLSPHIWTGKCPVNSNLDEFYTSIKLSLVSIYMHKINALKWPKKKYDWL